MEGSKEISKVGVNAHGLLLVIETGYFEVESSVEKRAEPDKKKIWKE